MGHTCTGRALLGRHRRRSTYSQLDALFSAVLFTDDGHNILTFIEVAFLEHISVEVGSGDDSGTFLPGLDLLHPRAIYIGHTTHLNVLISINSHSHSQQHGLTVDLVLHVFSIRVASLSSRLLFCFTSSLLLRCGLELLSSLLVN